MVSVSRLEVVSVSPMYVSAQPNKMLAGNLRLTSTPSRGSKTYFYTLHTAETGLMSLWLVKFRFTDRHKQTRNIF